MTLPSDRDPPSPAKDMFDSRIEPSVGLSEQVSAQLEDSIFNPLNKTLDS